MTARSSNVPYCKGVTVTLMGQHVSVHQKLHDVLLDLLHTPSKCQVRPACDPLAMTRSNVGWEITVPLSPPPPSAQISPLCLDLVFPLEQFVDVCKIVRPWCNGVCTSLGRVALLLVGLFPQVAHLENMSGGHASMRDLSLT